MIHPATYRNYIRSYIGCICKYLFVNPQVFYKSVFVVTLVAFVKKTSQCLWSPASQENRIGFVNLVVCFDMRGPKFLMSARQLKKEEQNGISMHCNGGHLHARKSVDQVHLPPDLPDSSRRMLASISMFSILSVVWPQLTFSLLISELFILKARGSSFHFHCQLPTEAYEDFQSFTFTFLK